MAIHHIQVQVVGASLLDKPDLACKLTEVAREDRGSNKKRSQMSISRYSPLPSSTIRSRILVVRRTALVSPTT